MERGITLWGRPLEFLYIFFFMEFKSIETFPPVGYIKVLYSHGVVIIREDLAIASHRHIGGTGDAFFRVKTSQVSNGGVVQNN